MHVALYTEREEIVSLLISAGADQRARDKIGRNAIHAVLGNRNGGAKTSGKKLQAMIDLFDKDGVKEMLLERCISDPGALTPLAYWMSRSGGTCKKIRMIEILSRYSTGEDLEMINGEGDLPLHVAVKQGLSSITGMFVSVQNRCAFYQGSGAREPNA